MYKQADRIFETGQCAGIGNVSLLGPFSGLYKTFASFMLEGDTTTILIESTVANEAEVCDATMTGGQLVRGAVLWSTNVDNSRVAFLTGLKRVMMSDTVARALTTAGGSITGDLTVEGNFSAQDIWSKWIDLRGPEYEAGFAITSLDAPANQRMWQAYADRNALYVQALDDAFVGVGEFTFLRNGEFYTRAITAGEIMRAQSILAQSSTGNPTVGWANDANAVNFRKWDSLVWVDSNLYLRATNDDGTMQVQWEFHRDGSTAIPGPTTIGGALTAGGGGLIYDGWLSTSFNANGILPHLTQGYAVAWNVIGGSALVNHVNQWENAGHSFETFNTGRTALIPALAFAKTPDTGANARELVTAAWVLAKGYSSGGGAFVPLDGSVDMTGGLKTPGVTAKAAASPSFSWAATGNGVDQKYWNFYQDAGGALQLLALDDLGAQTHHFTFDRGGNFVSGRDIGRPVIQIRGGGTASGDGVLLSMVNAGTAIAHFGNTSGIFGTPWSRALGLYTAGADASLTLYLNGSQSHSFGVGGTFSSTGPHVSSSYIQGTQLSARAALAQMELFATSAVAESRRWDFTAWDDGRLYLRSTTDAGGVQAQMSFGRDASLIMSGGMSAAAYQLSGHTVLYSPLANFTGLANYADGAINIFLGGGGDKSNYHRNDQHLLQSLDGGVTWLTVNTSGALFGIGGTMPTPSGAAVSTEIITAAWVVAKNFATTAALASYLTIATAASTYAPINAPVFTGDARAVTPAAGDSDTSIATTAYVRAELGYLKQTIQAGNYTTLQGDAGGSVYHASGAGAAAYTIAANSSVPYLLGTTITFANDSATAITILCGGTDVLAWSPAGTTGTRTLAQNGVCTALKVTSTRWLLSGTGLT